MPRRRFMKKRTKRVVKRRSTRLRIIKNNENTTFPFKCTAMFNLSPSCDGNLQFFSFTVPLNAPTMIVNLGGTYQQIQNSTGILGAQIGSAWASLFGAGAVSTFDQYKILKLTIKYTPEVMSTQASSALYPILEAPNIIYSYNDYDDVSRLTNEATCLNKGIAGRPYNSGKPVRFTMKNRKAMASEWLNTSNYSQLPTTSLTGNIPVELSQVCGIKIGMPIRGNPTGASSLGRFYITWDMLFKGISNNAV